jgi:hypothetical protein
VSLLSAASAGRFGKSNGEREGALSFENDSFDNLQEKA